MISNVPHDLKNTLPPKPPLLAKTLPKLDKPFSVLIFS